MLISFEVLIYQKQCYLWLAVCQVRELNGRLGEGLNETQLPSKKAFLEQETFLGNK